MTDLWIVHRDAAARAALQRLTGARTGVRAGGPDDPGFDEGGGEPVVVLGLAGDLEAELDFAGRHVARRPEARWILVRHPEVDAREVERLFAGLPARHLVWPPRAAALREAVARAARTRTPLAARIDREALERRFGRWFADVTLPEIRRAFLLGPDRVLVCGEEGTGRLLLARMLHARSAGAEEAFHAVSCGPETRLADLAAGMDASQPRVTLCLEDVDRLPAAVQRGLRAWIELGPESGPLRGRCVEWIATAGPEGAERLAPELAETLARLVVRIPPLRERQDLVEPFAVATAAGWCARHGQPVRAFEPGALSLLRDHPWPGNLRELEAVVARTLAAEGGDPVEAQDLRFEAEAAAEAPAAPEAGGEGLADAEDVLAGLGLEEPPAFAAEEPGAPTATERVEPAAPGNGRPAPEAGRVEPAAPGGREAAASERAPAPDGEPRAMPPDRGPLVPRLARALAHEVRNPLTAIRTFAALLPERFDDPEFREHFRRTVGADVERIEAVLERLSRFAAAGPPHRTPVDVTGLLEGLLEERRPVVQERRLLVLQELDPARPLVSADPEQLRLAFELLLDRALAWVPDRADLFVASKHHAAGWHGAPAVRVLLRFYSPHERAAREPGTEDVSLRESTLELVLAEHLVRAQGGALRVDTTEADEVVLLLDLPAV